MHIFIPRYVLHHLHIRKLRVNYSISAKYFDICSSFATFFMKRGVRGNSSHNNYQCSLMNIKHIQSLVTLWSKCSNMNFIFLSPDVKVIGVLKAYIMYLMKMKELSSLSFSCYTLITNSRTPFFYFLFWKSIGVGFIISYFFLGLITINLEFLTSELP